MMLSTSVSSYLRQTADRANSSTSRVYFVIIRWGAASLTCRFDFSSRFSLVDNKIDFRRLVQVQTSFVQVTWFCREKRFSKSEFEIDPRVKEEIINWLVCRSTEDQCQEVRRSDSNQPNVQGRSFPRQRIRSEHSHFWRRSATEPCSSSIRSIFSFEMFAPTEFPLSIAAVELVEPRSMIMTLVNGGAHLDFRTRRSALTALHLSSIHQRKQSILVGCRSSSTKDTLNNRSPCLSDSARTRRIGQCFRSEQFDASLSFDSIKKQLQWWQFFVVCLDSLERSFDRRLLRQKRVDWTASSGSSRTRTTRRTFTLLSGRHQSSRRRWKHAVAHINTEQSGLERPESSED